MSAQPASTLTVRLDGEVVRVLRPDRLAFTFGRGRACSLRLGRCGQNGDRHISRTAGSLHWQDGLWTVRNDGSRPFDILDPAAVPWPPGSVWAIGPDGVRIGVNSPIRPYAIELQPAGPGNRFDSARQQNDVEPSTFPVRPPSHHERILLGAKFLSRRQPGMAIGNEKAAERAGRVTARQVTAKAVEDVVRRAKEGLKQLGVQGLEGRENANRLGFALLSHGVNSQEDALPLPPVGDDDG